MGTDIHLHIEIKVNGKWEHYNKPKIDRNYELFAKLAGVRIVKGIEPISLPKGLPEDLSAITKMHADWQSEFQHSHSWLDVNEIREVEEWWKKYYLKHWHTHSTEGVSYIESQWGYLFGDAISGFGAFPESYPAEIEDVRMVFWFDS